MFGKLNGAARSEVEVTVETLAQIVEMAREREAESNADRRESGAADALRVVRSDVDVNLRRAIGRLSEDQQAVLVALTWIGGGRYNAIDFDLALTKAFDRRGAATADYLLAMPDFPVALEHGASACGAEFGDASHPYQRLPNGFDHQ